MSKFVIFFGAFGMTLNILGIVTVSWWWFVGLFVLSFLVDAFMMVSDAWCDERKTIVLENGNIEFEVRK